MTQSKELLTKLAAQLDVTYRMEVHAPKAYDLSSKGSEKKPISRTDEELFNILDKIPNV